MFTWIENYDVQETRRIARAEGLKEGQEKGLEKGLKKGRREGRKEGQEKGLEKGRREGQEKGLEKGLVISAEIIRALIEKTPVEDIASRFQISVEQIRKMQSVLDPVEVIHQKHQNTGGTVVL